MNLLKRRVCVGVVPILEPTYGGLHQYTLMILDALRHMELPAWIEIALVLQPEYVPSLPANLSNSWRRIIIPELHDPGAEVSPAPVRVGANRVPPVRRNHRLAQYLQGQTIDWLLFTSSHYRPGSQAFEIGLPYVMPVHDLQHRLQPEFPEVSENSATAQWEMREYVFSHGIRNASFVLVDSEVGREDVLTFYGDQGARADRITILPYLPPAYLHADVSEADRARVRTAYNLPERFLFYPAQFWPHKNHCRVVEAIAEARNRGTVMDAVFCGSSTGGVRQAAMQELVAVAQKRGVANQIRLLGYVPNEDMSPLYAQAVALIIPTFFGPTIIPVLEAWAFGCPVLTSDIRGIREQVGDAALLVDPRSIESITDGIMRIWGDAHLRGALSIRGRKRLAAYTPADFRNRLGNVVLNMCHRVMAGSDS